MSDDNRHFSRRQVLKSLAAAAVCPAVVGCEFATIRDGDAVDESRFSIDDAGYGALRDIGGTACHSHGAQPILLVRTADDEVVAFDRICPHQNRDMGDCDGNPLPAEWDDERDILICAVHGSAFGTDGEFVEGPDPDTTPDIATFPVEFDARSGDGTVFSDEPT